MSIIDTTDDKKFVFQLDFHPILHQILHVLDKDIFLFFWGKEYT